MFDLREWPHWLRATLASFTYLAIWINFSLPPLLANQPESFQATGSILVAWGILLLGVQRLKYESTIQQAERAAFIAAVNRLEAYRKINEERLNITFDVHMMQISQISTHLDLPNPRGPRTDEDLRELAESLDKRIAGRTTFPPPEEDEKMHGAVEHLKSTRETVEPWVKFIWVVELLFLVIGTLQWGYGDQWVIHVHEYFG